ncbi:hypothetical protein [Azotobacter salinestris]|uniref:hypothetical protein n=1 Tax=Azotobacter salinestris TaxID=69964 RepID=UPI0032DEF079
MLGWFKRNAEDEESTTLPPEVQAAIDGASFFVRPADDFDRVVVQLAGWNGFIHDDEAARRFLQSAFPELAEAQLRRAVRYLASKVGNHLRQVAAGSKPTRRNWVNSW